MAEMQMYKLGSGNRLGSNSANTLVIDEKGQGMRKKGE